MANFPVLNSDVHTKILSSASMTFSFSHVNSMIIMFGLLSLLGMQVIVLTEELLETSKQSEKSGLSFGGDADVSPRFHHNGGSIQHYLVIYLNPYACNKFTLVEKVVFSSFYFLF